VRGEVRWLQVRGAEVIVGSDLGEVHRLTLPDDSAGACAWRWELLAAIAVTWEEGRQDRPTLMRVLRMIMRVLLSSERTKMGADV
jgi:hypothetical protein